VTDAVVTDTAYARLDREGQVRVLRRLARAGAAAYGLDVARLTLVEHGYNTTFRVDTRDGTRVALRVNTNSKSTAANIAAQQAWVHALRAETPLLVPDALQTPDGGWFVEVPTSADGPLGAGVAVRVVANAWLAGPDVGQLTIETAREVGRAMAILHAHAEGWTPPPGARLPVFDSPLFGDPVRLPSDGTPLADTLGEARERCAAAFAEVYAGARPIALHADLHGGNLKWRQGRLAVFDFDDAGMGVPALDLAIATFYLRDGEPEREQALREGYAALRPLPDVAPEHLEAFLAARQLLLANSLIASSTAGQGIDPQRYLEVTATRLRRWLGGGRFALDPPWR